MANRRLLASLTLAVLAGGVLAADAPPIARKLPPVGVKLADDVRKPIEDELAKVEARIAALEAKKTDADLLADVKVYSKAVRYALLHDEFYKAKPPANARPGTRPVNPPKPPSDAPPRGIAVAKDLLKSASARLDALEKGQKTWTTAKGQIVRGYVSSIDGSVQPYGLEIPEEIDFSKPVPLYVWLHGRGDEQTDLYFIKGRDGGKRGEIQPRGAIVLHPFGRHCVGFKSAGEVDVLEAIDSVKRRYEIDENRIVLCGFSMGGAGTWHIGAHYADRFCALQPGAGFVDVKRYQNLNPANVPEAEQKLWGVYDVPAYVHNLFNVPVFSYSGENDKQRASANIMAEVYKANGRELKQFIGPKVEHKWLPLPELLNAMEFSVHVGRPRIQEHVGLQTRTLRYNRMYWLEATTLGRHWEDARVTAIFNYSNDHPDVFEYDHLNVFEIANITQFRLRHPAPNHPKVTAKSFAISVEGTSLGRVPSEKLTSPEGVLVTRTAAGKWSLEAPANLASLAKRHGLQGPIDDAFVTPFLFVSPSGQSANPAVQKWVESEMRHQQDRWRALMRGDVRIKRDIDVTAEDIKAYHLICWGDPASNKVIANAAAKLPAKWADGKLTFRGETYDAATHVPAFIHPNPLNPEKYIVLNSALTFREAHDGTNSQQNPKLGDWAVLDITLPPSAAAPAKIVKNGFFDEAWK